MLKQLAWDRNYVPPSPVSGLVTALGAVQSPRALTAMVHAVMERSRGDLTRFLLGSPHPTPLHQEPWEPAKCRVQGAGCSSAPGALGHCGNKGTGCCHQPCCQEQHQLNPGMESPSQTELEESSLHPWRIWGLQTSGVAKPGSRTGRNDGEHL